MWAQTGSLCRLASESCSGQARSENHQSGTRAMLAWLIETWTGHPPVHADCVRAGLNKRTMAPAGTLVLPALSLKPDNSVLSHMSLLFLCWSLVEAFVSESV